MAAIRERERIWQAHKRKVGGKKSERNNTSHSCSAAWQGHSRTEGGDDPKKWVKSPSGEQPHALLGQGSTTRISLKIQHIFFFKAASYSSNANAEGSLN